jgi:hypothetical protein
VSAEAPAQHAVFTSADQLFAHIAAASASSTPSEQAQNAPASHEAGSAPAPNNSGSINLLHIIMPPVASSSAAASNAAEDGGPHAADPSAPAADGESVLNALKATVAAAASAGAAACPGRGGGDDAGASTSQGPRFGAGGDGAGGSAHGGSGSGSAGGGDGSHAGDSGPGWGAYSGALAVWNDASLQGVVEAGRRMRQWCRGRDVNHLDRKERRRLRRDIERSVPSLASGPLGEELTAQQLRDLHAYLFGVLGCGLPAAEVQRWYAALQSKQR